jgi:hypothetical protein
MLGCGLIYQSNHQFVPVVIKFLRFCFLKVKVSHPTLFRCSGSQPKPSPRAREFGLCLDLRVLCEKPKIAESDEELRHDRSSVENALFSDVITLQEDRFETGLFHCLPRPWTTLERGHGI